MIRNLFLTVSTAIATIGASAPLPAIAADAPYPPGTYPTGSYRATCSNIHFLPGNPYMLVANCQPKDASVAAAQSRLNISPCKDGTIYNDNGRLQCPWDWPTQNISDATRNREPFRAAGTIVMGRDPDIPTIIKWMKFGYTKTQFITPMDQATLDFAQASELLKLYLVEKATPQERNDVYRAAYKQVYGVYPGPILVGDNYDADMKAGKAWYATIVLAERKKKNTPPAPAPTGGTPPPPIH